MFLETRLSGTVDNTFSFSALQAVSRRVYRLLRRALTLWNPSVYGLNLRQITQLWLVLLTPWRCSTWSDTATLRHTLDILSARPADSRRSNTGDNSSGGAGGSAAGLIFGAGVGAAASSLAKLNRFGSEMAHNLQHLGQHGAEGEPLQRFGGQQVRGWWWLEVGSLIDTQGHTSH